MKQIKITDTESDGSGYVVYTEMTDPEIEGFLDLLNESGYMVAGVVE